MESNYITLILLPMALGIIMLGLGISLTIADFKRVIVYPKAIFIGLFCQMLLLPILCFFLAKMFNLSPELAVGLMLLSASPGGPTANLFSYLAKGDVALNICSLLPTAFSRFLPCLLSSIIPLFILWVQTKAFPCSLKRLLKCL